VKLKFVICLFVVLVSGSYAAKAQSESNDELQKLLPNRIGSFQRAGSPQLDWEDRSSMPARFKLAGSAKYTGSRGESFNVSIGRYAQEVDAYARLTLYARVATDQPTEIGAVVGTASAARDERLMFVRGNSFVFIADAKKQSPDAKLEFARVLADTIDKGEGEIPVLIKHLPQWEQAQKSAVFVSRFSTLEPFVGDLPAVNSIAPEGDADAVLAQYGSARMLLIEFNTPQRATENDQRVVAKIRELWDRGLKAPTAYRRVGNYIVFVFDAPDEQTAKALIDQVKYEQVVQWLGENPNVLKEAQRRYVNTTLGVFVAVIKASGFAALACLGVGGLFGALLFTRRRAQQRASEAFSDAGGMLRLNLDELSAQTDPSRLLRDRN
jgi:hypothetical protein